MIMNKIKIRTASVNDAEELLKIYSYYLFYNLKQENKK